MLLKLLSKELKIKDKIFTQFIKGFKKGFYKGKQISFGCPAFKNKLAALEHTQI